MPHSQVSDYVKTDIAMSHLTCLGEIFPWSCHKVIYSLRKVTELCPNDRVALLDEEICELRKKSPTSVGGNKNLNIQTTF
jgi:hypothetical protein